MSSEFDRLLARIPKWVVGVYIAVLVMPSTLVLLLIGNHKVSKSYAPTFVVILVSGFFLTMIFGFFYGRAQERVRREGTGAGKEVPFRESPD